MGSGRESLLPALLSWVRRVHVGTDRTRSPHPKISGQPGLRGRDCLAELSRQHPLPRGAFWGGSQFRRRAPAVMKGSCWRLPRLSTWYRAPGYCRRSRRAIATGRPEARAEASRSQHPISGRRRPAPPGSRRLAIHGLTPSFGPRRCHTQPRERRRTPDRRCHPT